MKKNYSLLILLTALLLVGCGKKENVAVPSVQTEGHHHEHSVNGWCIEHEVPENECSLCSSKVAAEYKKNGDWCAEHDRAESQCFLCDPSRKEKFVAKYEAQYGQKPPKPEH